MKSKADPSTRSQGPRSAAVRKRIPTLAIFVLFLALMAPHSNVYPFEIPKRYEKETGWLKVKRDDRYGVQKNFANSIIAANKSLRQLAKVRKTAGLKKTSKVEDSSTEFAASIKEILDLKRSIAAADKALRNEFAKTEKRCIDEGFSDVILERHRKMVAGHEKGIKTLFGHFDALEKSVNEGKMDLILDSIEQIKDHLERHPVRKDPPILSRDRLSGPEQQVETRKARRRSETFQPTSHTAQESSMYLAFDQSEDGIDSSYEPASSSDLPSPGDLAPTIDVQITPEIEDLAASLDHSPMKMFEYVRNNFDFEPYKGSWKGSQQTLLQGSGNDSDLASLLIALLRASGIPARYVEGRVELSPDRAMNWLGVESLDVLTEMHDKVLVGFIVDVSLESVLLTHVWVEAYIPYTNYRGLPADQTGKMWVPMDPSFKQYKYHNGIDVVSEMGFDAEKFIDDYISTFHQLSPFELFLQEVRDYLELNHPDMSYADIVRTREIIPESIGFIPGSLPFDVDWVNAVYSEIDAYDRYSVEIIIYEAWPVIEYEAAIPEILGKRITIGWIASTQDDQDVIDSYGGLYQTPPNLVRLRPVLKINGDVVAVGATDDLWNKRPGEEATLQFFFTPPSGAYDSWPYFGGIQNPIIAGSNHALVISTQRIAPATLRHDAKIPVKDIYAGQVLWHTGINYLDRLAGSYGEAAKIMRTLNLPDLREAIVGDDILVTYDGYGSLLTFEWKGLFIDVDHAGSRSFSGFGDKSRERTIRYLTGANSSILENRIFEDLYDAEAVSTIKILELARDMGIPICKISTSIKADCPSLNVSENVRIEIGKELQKAIDIGEKILITVPEREITYLDWTGTGYISMDPETGSSGYFISGGHNGGSTACWYTGSCGPPPPPPPCEGARCCLIDCKDPPPCPPPTVAISHPRNGEYFPSLSFFDFVIRNELYFELTYTYFLPPHCTPMSYSVPTYLSSFWEYPPVGNHTFTAGKREVEYTIFGVEIETPDGGNAITGCDTITLSSKLIPPTPDPPLVTYQWQTDDWCLLDCGDGIFSPNDAASTEFTGTSGGNLAVVLKATNENGTTKAEKDLKVIEILKIKAQDSDDGSNLTEDIDKGIEAKTNTICFLRKDSGTVNITVETTPPVPDEADLPDDWKIEKVNGNLDFDGAVGKLSARVQKDTLGEMIIKVSPCALSSDHFQIRLVDANVLLSEHADQDFGYDEEPKDEVEYVSLDKTGTTKVNVTVNPFKANAFRVTSSDTGKFKVPGDAIELTSATTEIDLTGENFGGNHERALLQIRGGSKDGFVLKSLHVELYKEKTVPTIWYYRIKDSTVAGTTPAKNPTFDDLKVALNDVYKQAVIEVVSVNGDRDKSLRYDRNNNGFLDYYNDGTNPELNVITGAGLVGSPKIAYVEKIRDNWRMAAAAAAGANTITLVDASKIGTGGYTVGAATGAGEPITISSVNKTTNVITLSARLSSNHAATETVYSELAGLAGNPQLVTDADGELIETIVHEMLHRAYFGGLLDLEKNDNVMYWTTGATDDKIRYRQQKVVETGTGVPTGAKEKQWDKIAR
jgi:transglutaminase-like putative cysteine protease